MHARVVVVMWLAGQGLSQFIFTSRLVQFVGDGLRSVHVADAEGFHLEIPIECIIG